MVKPLAESGDLAAGAAPAVAIRVWPGGWSANSLTLDDILAYQRDPGERTILFWGTLRQRADNMIAHERAGKPPLLDFDYELILDARRFERSVNYALPRITRYGDKYQCQKLCPDVGYSPQERPQSPVVGGGEAVSLGELIPRASRACAVTKPMIPQSEGEIR